MRRKIYVSGKLKLRGVFNREGTKSTETALTEAQYLYEMQTTLNFFGAGRMDDLF